MKNVLIIDGAHNCAYDVFSFTEGLFYFVFPKEGQDIAFIEEVLETYGQSKVDKMFAAAWDNKQNKKHLNGIDGILFYELMFQKRMFYPNRRDSDLDHQGRSK